MSDDAEEEDQQQEEKQHTIKVVKKKIPPTVKGTKNSQGDYVVTTIDIPDIRTGIKKDGGEVNDEDESDSDTEYDDEDDTKETAAVEESKTGKYNYKFEVRIHFYVCWNNSF